MKAEWNAFFEPQSRERLGVDRASVEDLDRGTIGDGIKKKIQNEAIVFFGFTLAWHEDGLADPLSPDKRAMDEWLSGSIRSCCTPVERKCVFARFGGCGVSPAVLHSHQSVVDSREVGGRMIPAHSIEKSSIVNHAGHGLRPIAYPSAFGWAGSAVMERSTLEKSS